MHTLAKAGASLLAGVAAFLLVGLGVTEALAPHVWLSLLLGLPAGLAAGMGTVPLAYLGLTAWAERRDTGSVSARTGRRLRTTLVALAAGVLTAASVVAVAAVGGVGLATATLVALVAGVVAATLAALFVSRYERGATGGDTPRSESSR
jgi:hypothetical protein